jgi:hypothetical protein
MRKGANAISNFIPRTNDLRFVRHGRHVDHRVHRRGSRYIRIITTYAVMTLVCLCCPKFARRLAGDAKRVHAGEYQDQSKRDGKSNLHAD